MNAEQVAHELITYYRFSRGRGHTTAMVKGAIETDALVLVAHGAQRDYVQHMGIPKKNLKVLSTVTSGTLRGFQRPLVIDHFAMQLLLEQLLHDYDKAVARILELEEQVSNESNL